MVSGLGRGSIGGEKFRQIEGISWKETWSNHQPGGEKHDRPPII